MRKLRGEGLQQSKQDRYDQIRNPDCHRCPLHKTTKHVCLIGQGDLNASVMFIGEAPGRREDDIGKPFAGQSGQLLDSLLSELEEDRETVYITNVVHCRPPDNRTPKISEANKCKMFMEREIDLVRPKVIVALGNTSAKALVGKTGITKIRGQVFEYDGNFKAHVIPTYHPAGVLRTPGYLDSFVEDVEKAFNIANDGYRVKRCKYKVIKTIGGIKKLVRMIQKKGYCATDVETNTLKWWDSNILRLVSVGFSITEGKGYTVLLDHNDPIFSKEKQKKILKYLNKHIFNNSEVRKIGHNIKYDMHVLMQFGCRFSGPIDDTMYMHHLLDENRPHDLDSLSIEFTEYGNYWEKVNQYGLKQGKAPEMPHDILGEYGATDCDVTLHAFNRMWPEIKKHEPFVKLYNYLYIPSMLSVIEAEERGIHIDHDRLNDLAKKMKEELHKVDNYLRQFKAVGRVEKYLEKRKAEDGKKWSGKLNFNSTDQVSELIFGKHGFDEDVIEETDAGAPSTSEDVLIELIRKKGPIGKFARKLLEYRKIKKLDSTYVSGLYKYIGPDGRLHASFRVNGTKPGRMSCRQPNMQNIPRAEPSEYDTPLKALVKTVFTPTPGFELLHWDISQAELRILAHFAKESRMMEWFRTDKDIHTYVGAEMMGMPVSKFVKLKDFKPLRKRAKTVNFGTIYEVGPNTLSKNLSSPSKGIYFSKNEAKQFLREYFERFPAIRMYIDDQHRICRERGYVTTLFGQRRRLPDINSQIHGIRTEAERQATNSPIQGTAGQITMFGMSYMLGYIDGVRRIPKDCFFINQVHDDIIVEVKPELVKKVGKEIADVLENLPIEKYFGKSLSVPLKVEAEHSIDSWAESKKLE